MAIEASDKLNVSDDFDDEDGPVIFKRSGTAKKNQLHSDVRKSTSLSNDRQLHRNTSEVPASNGQNSTIQKCKTVPSAKASPTKASVGLSKASTSHAKTSPVNSLVAKSNLSSLGDKPKPLSEQKKITINVKEENNSIKQEKDNSEDSEDDKPLSARLKINSNHASKATLTVVKKPSEESDDDDDDDVPLSARLSRNSNVGTSGSNYDNSNERKPFSKVQKDLDGSYANNKHENLSSISVKRPLDKTNSLHSSAKKSKLSDSAASIKTKQLPVKHEPKVDDDDDDDDIPISQRIKKSAASGDKSLSMKNSVKVTKVNKAGSTSFKKAAKKSKKFSNGSGYSKSTKLLPSSGDGQKKWTTLVHNGVIFPPPYQPHGIKMLYKGRPVDLTPGQEEVSFYL